MSASSPPVTEERMMILKEKLQLKDSDIMDFWRLFQTLVDAERMGLAAIQTICEHLEERRTIIIDAIFELGGEEKVIGADSNNDATLIPFFVGFFHFIQGICSFVMLRTVTDMCKFIFFLTDKSKHGYISAEALENIISILHSNGNYFSRIEANVPKHTKKTLNSQTYEGDLVTFDEFQALCKTDPNLLFPIFRLQQKLCARIMGDSWWERKKAAIYGEQTRHLHLRQRKILKEQQRLRHEQIAMFKAKIGFVGYFFNHEKRRELVALNPLPIVYLDENGDIQYGSENIDREIH